MIRMSETTRTHTPGKQLDCYIFISSLMKHVLTNRSMFHSDSEKLRSKILATKSSSSDQTWHIEKQSLIWSVIWYSFVFSSVSVSMLLDPRNGIALINFERAYTNSVVSNGSYHWYLGSSKWQRQLYLSFNVCYRKEYIHFICRPMLVYRMTPVPLRLFHKNLGNLQVFPVGQVVRSFPPSPPPPPPATNGPYRHPW